MAEGRLPAHPQGWCPGIDGVTAADYTQNLEANLLDLLARIKSHRCASRLLPRAHYFPRVSQVSPENMEYDMNVAEERRSYMTSVNRAPVHRIDIG
jgi:hypothetical protein